MWFEHDDELEDWESDELDDLIESGLVPPDTYPSELLNRWGAELPEPDDAALAMQFAQENYEYERRALGIPSTDAVLKYYFSDHILEFLAERGVPIDEWIRYLRVRLSDEGQGEDSPATNKARSPGECINSLEARVKESKARR